ncbi:MAG TPA: hypothetical protein VG942_12525 [Hyphomonadaceae bacterium]|nr:hypothetical protein [Hyphomonadaceae bacterium]
MNPPDDPVDAPPERPKVAPKPPANLPETVRPTLPPETIRPKADAPPSFTDKMFGPIRISGWIQLGLICVGVGAIFEAGGVNPFAPGFTLGGALGQFATGFLNVLGWTLTVAWRPLLLGAAAVLPVWLLWRAAVALFGKAKPPMDGPPPPRDLNEPYRPQAQSKRWPDVV